MTNRHTHPFRPKLALVDGATSLMDRHLRCTVFGALACVSRHRAGLAYVWVSFDFFSALMFTYTPPSPVRAENFHCPLASDYTGGSRVKRDETPKFVGGYTLRSLGIMIRRGVRL